MKKKFIIQLFCFLLPWFLRRKVLNKLFHFKIEKTARIGFSLILSDTLTMKNRASIGHLTIVFNINNLLMEEGSFLGPLNWVTGINIKNKTAFRYEKDRKCELVIGSESRVTSRHFFDCNGGIYIGEYTTIAGLRSVFLSHSVNVHESIQTAGPIIVGKFCFVSTGCTFLKDSVLPDYSVLGAGSLLNKKHHESYYLYAGVPAKPLKILPKDSTKYFTRTNAFID